MRPFVEALNALEPELLERRRRRVHRPADAALAGRARSRSFSRRDARGAPRSHVRDGARPARGSRSPPASGHARRHAVVRGELAEHDLRVPRERNPVHRQQRRRHSRARRAGRPRPRAVRADAGRDRRRLCVARSRTETRCARRGRVRRCGLAAALGGRARAPGAATRRRAGATRRDASDWVAAVRTTGTCPSRSSSRRSSARSRCRAPTSSPADCFCRARRVHLFPGEPGALGLLANGYGTVALVRRSLLESGMRARARRWPLLARAQRRGREDRLRPDPARVERIAAGDAGDRTRPRRCACCSTSSARCRETSAPRPSS